MDEPGLIRWEAPGPYRVAFTTREGGVSTGPYAALNLGLATDDDPADVIENRRRACAAIDVDPERATMARQVHGATVTRARPTGILEARLHDERDGVWSDESGQAMLLLTADCVPVAVCRTGSEAPALALAHAGWRGLLAGIVGEAAAALGEGPRAAAIGPAIGPCCFEVSTEIATAFRDRFGADVVSGRHVDLWQATERALHEAGCLQIERVDRCTACEATSFFSHRRDRGITGRQGVIGVVV